MAAAAALELTIDTVKYLYYVDLNCTTSPSVMGDGKSSSHGRSLLSSSWVVHRG